MCRAKPQQKQKQPPPQALNPQNFVQNQSSFGGGEELSSPIRSDIGTVSSKPKLDELLPPLDDDIPVNNFDRGKTEKKDGENDPYPGSQGCVALALNGDVAELARLASQCLELLASQSVTAVDDILA